MPGHRIGCGPRVGAPDDGLSRPGPGNVCAPKTWPSRDLCESALATGSPLFQVFRRPQVPVFASARGGIAPTCTHVHSATTTRDLTPHGHCRYLAKLSRRIAPGALKRRRAFAFSGIQKPRRCASVRVPPLPRVATTARSRVPSSGCEETKRKRQGISGRERPPGESWRGEYPNQRLSRSRSRASWSRYFSRHCLEQSATLYQRCRVSPNLPLQ